MLGILSILCIFIWFVLIVRHIHQQKRLKRVPHLFYENIESRILVGSMSILVAITAISMLFAHQDLFMHAWGVFERL